jgi:thiol-disulfide isomerase/thioredoxin
MRGRSLSQRLLALGGIVVIVTAGVGVLWAAGLIGNQGGGEGIEDVVLSDPVRAAGQADLEIGAERGQLAPDFEISDFDGVRHRLSDFRGQPVYVNFWATWCVPCQIELPDVKVLADRHADDLAVITVNRREKLDTAESYFENIPLEDGSKGLGFTVDGIDPDDTLYREFRVLGMPASIFVDRDGVVTDVFNGLITLEMMEEAVAKAAGDAVLHR